MADIKIGEENFHVEIDGPEDAPVLLVSNSLGSTVAMWDLQTPALAQQFRVVRYDSRGHGSSAAPGGSYSIEQLGQDAIGILDALGIAKAHWLGLSMGGAVGLWLLANAPERIDRAVLANTAAQFGSPDVWNERLRLLHEDGMAGLAPGVVDRWFTQEFQERDPDAVLKIRAALEATPEDGYAGAVSALRDLDLRESMRAINAPVLVIVGARDPATPPEAGRAIAEAIVGAQLVELDTAHLSNIEAPEAFNQAVLSFLTAPVAPPASYPRRRPKKAVAATRSAPSAASAPAKTAIAKKGVKKGAATAPVAKPSTAKAAPKTGANKKATAKTVGAKESVAKTGTAKKPTSKISAGAKSAAKTTAAKKAPAKKGAVKSAAGTKKPLKSAAKTISKAAPKKASKAVTKTKAKAAPKKAVAKKAFAKGGKKPVAKKAPAKKPVIKKSVAKKSEAKKSPAKKPAAQKTVAKKSAVKTQKTAVTKKPLAKSKTAKKR